MHAIVENGVRASPRLGDDVAAIIKQISATNAGVRKQELETTAEYEARRNRAIPRGEFVFVIRSDEPY